MKRPNVLIIQTDQQSTWTLSCYGGTEISTPHIDSIANTGSRFDNFYTVSAVCTPSRGCFMSGQYPHTHGAYRNDVPIRPCVKTFAQIMKENGYRTSYVGKWHLAGAEKPFWLSREQSMGFDDCSCMFNCSHSKKITDADCESAHNAFAEKDGSRAGDKECGSDGKRPRIEENDTVVGSGAQYTTDFLTDKAIEKICAYVKKSGETQTEPFLLMLSIPDPHQPYTVRAPYDTLFAPENVKVPVSFYERMLPDWAENDEWGRHRYFPIDMSDREKKFRKIKAQYCGEVACVDDNVGRIIRCLKDCNIYDNTVIVFTSDHGDYMGEHGLLEKNNLYESVYRIPLIISFPGKIGAGSVINTYVSIVDFQPTLLNLLDLPLSAQEQGRDVSCLFEHDSADWEEVVFIHPNDVPRAGILTREYELAYVGSGWQNQKEFKDHILFDRKNDIDQMHNLFYNKAYQPVIEKLTVKMAEHFKKLHFDKNKLPPPLSALL